MTSKSIYILAGLIFLLLFSSCSREQKLEEYIPESAMAETTGNTVRGLAVVGSMDRQPELFVQMGHIAGSFSYTNALAFIQNGKYILSGNGDGTIKLWEAQTGREVKTFRCLDDVTHIDVSKDGRYLVSGDMSHQENVNFWDISSGQKLKSFYSDSSCNGHPVLFCNNDTNILSGCGQETMRLWDIESGTLIREFKADSGSSRKPDVSAIVLSPDGRSAVAGYRYNGKEEVNGVYQDVESSDYTIRVWDLATGEQRLAFNKENGWVSALDITPDGKFVISCDWQQEGVSVWDIETGTRVSTLPGSADAIDISASGRYALFGGYMGFRLVELASGKEIRKINHGFDGWVRSIKFSPDGKYALVGDDTSKPMLWDIETVSQAAAFGGYTGQLETVKLSRTGNVMLTANDYDDVITIWDYKNGRMIKTVARDSGSIMSSATISPDGTLMATGGWNGRTSNAIVWDIASSKQIAKMELEEETGSHTQFLQFSDDNKYLVWANQNRFVISDVRTGNKVKTVYDSLNCIEKFYINSKTETLIVTMLSGATKIYKYSLKNGELIDKIGSIDKTGLFQASEFSYVFGAEFIYEFSRVEDLEKIKNYHEKLRLTHKYPPIDEMGIDGFLTVSDLNTLEIIKRRKIQNRYFFSDGIEYNTNTLFTSHVLSPKIDKYDVNAEKVVAQLIGHTDAITNLELTPDRKFLCSGSRDGTVRFWDPETGKEVAQFISFSDGEWIVITPKGYFNASPNGAKYLNVRIGNQVYSIDNFYEKYYNPAYVASVLQGKAVQPESDIRQGVSLPPEVTIISPATNSELKNDAVDITVSARDMGGGIDEIRLFQNGKAVGEETRGIKVVPENNKRLKTYTVTLVDGVNTFRAIGFSRDRTESNPSEITITLLGGEKKISLYVLAVGINTYKNPALNLNYAEPDARAIADFFRKRGSDLFKTVKVTDVYNEQASKAGLVSSLKTLENTKPQDAVLIYLAGHGENINEKWYFIPYDLTYPEREDDVREKAVSSDELSSAIRNITAQKVLVLIDACKSGAVLLSFRGFEDRKALSQLSRATGVHVVAASSKDQFATEVKELGHGVFTYTLLEGLNGKAVSKGETITVRKLMAYIEEELPELTKKYRQEAQYPVVDSKGMDFPLVKSK